MLECVLLDRDGTLNRERADYVKSWEEFEWLPGALDALRQLAVLETPIVLITNQSAIGRGIITSAGFDLLQQQMLAEIRQAGGRIDATFVCPHTPDAGCDCRKPKPGLLEQAARTFGVDLRNSIFVGDAVTDLRAAQTVSCRSILVRTGRQGPQLDELLGENSDVEIVADLSAAVSRILAMQGSFHHEVDR